MLLKLMKPALRIQNGVALEGLEAAAKAAFTMRDSARPVNESFHSHGGANKRDIDRQDLIRLFSNRARTRSSTG